MKRESEKWIFKILLTPGNPVAQSARFSFGRYKAEKEIGKAVEALKEATNLFEAPGFAGMAANMQYAQHPDFLFLEKVINRIREFMKKGAADIPVQDRIGHWEFR